MKAAMTKKIWQQSAAAASAADGGHRQHQNQQHGLAGALLARALALRRHLLPRVVCGSDVNHIARNRGRDTRTPLRVLFSVVAAASLRAARALRMTATASAHQASKHGASYSEDEYRGNRWQFSQRRASKGSVKVSTMKAWQ